MADIGDIYTWRVDSISIILRYFIIAGSAYLFFYVWNRRRMYRLKIQKKKPQPMEIQHEIFYSVCTLAIFCFISFIVFELEAAGKTMIYRDFHHYGTVYFVFSIFIMIVIHDAYFYWTHRLMHTRIFRHIHKTHHHSTNPTPWASFSFHPGEAFIAAGIIPLIVFLIPCHPYAIVTFLTIMTLTNVMGHLGYEIFPKWITKSKFGKWQNTSTNHNIHHQHSRCHYGLYFTFWDYIMRTAYDEKSPVLETTLTEEK